MPISSDIFLTHGYFLREDAHEVAVMKPYPPLGILSLSAYLKSRDFRVEVYDSTFHSREEFLLALRSTRAGCVGIYCNLLTRQPVLWMIHACKSLGKTIVLGGPEPTSYPKEFIDAGADVIVCGEGEHTTEELLSRINTPDANRLQEVHGIVFRDEVGQIVTTPPRALIDDLNRLPFPDRGAIDIGNYTRVWRDRHGLGSLSLITARGCPYTCKWCSHSVFGYSHRRRTPESVVNEIELLRDQYRPDMLWFADDVFTIHHGWMLEFSREMKRRQIKIPFECISRADRLNEEILKTLASIGCFRVWVGSESGSQKVLDAMSRGVTIQQISQTTRLARRFGIQTGLFVMLGYEGEDVKDIDLTVALLKESNPSVFVTTVAYPIKGTPYEQSIQSRIVAHQPWHNRTERDLDVLGRYSKNFYWYAQRHVVNEVRRHQLLRTWNRNVSLHFSSAIKAKAARWGMQIDRALRGREQVRG
jgi:anaerobic magnesium-protoporphyrin IX monomethyl ester cyclase